MSNNNKNTTKIVAIITIAVVVLVLGIFAIIFLSSNGTQKAPAKTSVTINENNFTQYFDVQVSLSNKRETSASIIGKNVQYDLVINIQPKTTIASGSVNVELNFHGYNIAGWECEYATHHYSNGYKFTEAIIVPITFAANNAYTKSINIKYEHYTSSSDDLVLDYDITSASGTIEC